MSMMDYNNINVIEEEDTLSVSSATTIVMKNDSDENDNDSVKTETDNNTRSCDWCGMDGNIVSWEGWECCDECLTKECHDCNEVGRMNEMMELFDNDGETEGFLCNKCKDK